MDKTQRHVFLALVENSCSEQASHDSAHSLGPILLFMLSPVEVIGYFTTLNLMFQTSFLELVYPFRKSHRNTGFLKQASEWKQLVNRNVYFFNLFLIGGKTLCNFVIVSAVQQLWQISRDYACTTSLLSLPPLDILFTQNQMWCFVTGFFHLAYFQASRMLCHAVHPCAALYSFLS